MNNNVELNTYGTLKEFAKLYNNENITLKMVVAGNIKEATRIGSFMSKEQNDEFSL